MPSPRRSPPRRRRASSRPREHGGPRPRSRLGAASGGLSGAKNSRTNNSNAGAASAPSIQRQPVAVFPRLVSAVLDTSVDKQRQKNARDDAELEERAESAAQSGRVPAPRCKTGQIMEDAPNFPRPLTKRAPRKVPNVSRNRGETRRRARKATAHRKRILRRPNVSLRNPAAIAPGNAAEDGTRSRDAFLGSASDGNEVFRYWFRPVNHGGVVAEKKTHPARQPKQRRGTNGESRAAENGRPGMGRSNLPSRRWGGRHIKYFSVSL